MGCVLNNQKLRSTSFRFLGVFFFFDDLLFWGFYTWSSLLFLFLNSLGIVSSEIEFSLFLSVLFVFMDICKCQKKKKEEEPGREKGRLPTPPPSGHRRVLAGLWWEILFFFYLSSLLSHKNRSQRWNGIFCFLYTLGFFYLLPFPCLSLYTPFLFFSYLFKFYPPIEPSLHSHPHGLT